MARLAVLLIITVLTIAVAACNGSGTYQLSISSTSGGSVTTPGEGVFAYDAGTVVELVATPDDGYNFQAWTGDIEDITNPNSTSTNITINGDYSITASFEEEGGPSPSNPY
mgnify:CR=1 FL=1